MPLRLWHPTSKVRLKVGNIALYVLVAEAEFGAAAVHVEHQLRYSGSGVVGRVCGAGAVMALYTGALAIAWLVLEVGVL